MNTVMIGKSQYEVLFISKPGRVVIRYDGGLVVLADQNRDGTWDLSGQPASSEEQAVITRYMPANDSTEVDLVPDQARPKASAEEAPNLNPFLKNGAVYRFCDMFYRNTFGVVIGWVESFETKRAQAWFKRIEAALDKDLKKVENVVENVATDK